tara:strand:+ start:907 stop:2652 length:1746 start_codon:yes stop_codon:yes gene_type:complete
MTTLAEILSRRVSYTPTDPINVNNNISMGYRSNLDPRMGGTRSGLFPPSRSMIGGQGFSKSPFLEDVSNVSESIYNEALVPTYNTISQKIDPIFMGIKSYFGGDSSPVMGTIKEKDINLTNKKTTTDIPQTLTEQIQADINKAQENKDDTPDVSLQSQANQEGLLSNNEVKEQNNKGILSFTSQPAKEGSYTYSKPVSSNSLLNQNQTDSKSVVTNQQTNTEVNAVNNAPVVADPSVEAVATTNNEVTPTKTFMDKLTNFATSEFGQDFFASLLAQSGPTVGKPQSFGSNLGQAYQKARELQAERDKKTDGSDAISKGIITGNGKSAGLFSDKGKLYAEVDGVRYFEKDFERIFGKNYNFRTFGQQTFGILNGKQMADLDTGLTQDENSLTSFVNYLDAVGDTNTGVARIADNFLARIKIMVGGELSQEQFNLLLASAELPALIAQSRVELAGPGVLTDQDFIRLLETIGGDVNAYQNPQVVKDRISDLISKKYSTYKRNVDIYNGNVREQFKDLGYKERKLLQFDQDQLNLIDVDAQIKMGVFDPSSFPVNELVSMLNDPSVKTSSKEIIVEYLEGQGQL